MSDDIRHWADEGATAEELTLLASARAEQPDPSARLRTLQALGIAGGSPAPNGGGPGPAGPGAGAGAGLALAKLAAVVLVAGAAIVAVKRAQIPAPVLPPVAPAGASPSTVAPPPAAAPRAPETTAAPPPREPARHVRRRASSVAAAPRSPEPTLAAEVQALEQAQRALAARDPAAAQRALDRYDADFPAGKLAAEGVVLRVRALLLAGERARALALARAFAARHPDGAYARQLDALVGGGGDASAAPEKK